MSLHVKISWRRLVTLRTFQFLSDPRRASRFGQGPLANDQRRIVPHMLVMAAVEFCTPMAVVVLIKAGYSSLHSLDPLILRRAAAGFHQMKIDSAISQHAPDAITRGISCL